MSYRRASNEIHFGFDGFNDGIILIPPFPNGTKIPRVAPAAKH